MPLYPNLSGNVRTANNLSDVASAVASRANLFSTNLVSVQTGTSYTLTTNDNGSVEVLTNAAAITLTLPNNMPVGYTCTVVQGGAGQVTASAQAGGFLRHRQSHTKIAGQYGVVSFAVIANSGGSAAEWLMMGDTAA